MSTSKFRSPNRVSAVADLRQGSAAPRPKRRAARPGIGTQRQRTGTSGWLKVVAVIGMALVALAAIFLWSTSDDGAYAFQVGNPGPGSEAPAMRLPSTTGETFDLASLRGQTVLLYFQEGLMCQPCWAQLKDIEAARDEFEALGVDVIASITNDPLDPLRQKVADEGISTAVLSDPDLAVSRTYEANQYGMMGTTRNGHSFVLVNEDGLITWRADYGGAPNYTMYVPVDRLLADMREGLDAGKQ